MRISSTACYALQLLICLAEHQHLSHPLSATELAERTGVPEKFTRKILHALNSTDIVRSQRGIAGGYALALSPADISLTCIIRAVEGGIAPPAAQQTSATGLAASDVWTQAAQTLELALSGYTLQSIMQGSNFQDSPPQTNNTLPEDKNQGERQAIQKQDTGESHAKAPSLGRQRSRKPRNP